MVVKKILLLIIFIGSCAATGDYLHVNSILFTNISYLTTDKLSNTYVIVGNQMLQFDLNGKPLANFSRNNLGSIRSIDASNPMKILMFYPD